MAGKAGHGKARHGMAWQGLAGRGKARQAWQGKARQARHGTARHGEARQGTAGAARHSGGGLQPRLYSYSYRTTKSPVGNVSCVTRRIPHSKHTRYRTTRRCVCTVLSTWLALLPHRRHTRRSSFAP